jgi:hypothetical protein
MNLASALYFIFVFYTIRNKALANVWQDKYAIIAILVAPLLEFFCLGILLPNSRELRLLATQFHLLIH